MIVAEGVAVVVVVVVRAVKMEIDDLDQNRAFVIQNLAQIEIFVSIHDGDEYLHADAQYLVQPLFEELPQCCVTKVHIHGPDNSLYDHHDPLRAVAFCRLHRRHVHHLAILYCLPQLFSLMLE